MRIRVFGAAGEVTGSCYLVETDQARVLVEFGLHQGDPSSERRNRRMPPIRPRDLDAVVLTHAHLDHSGRLPMLVREGFGGPIWTTDASVELCDILLKDSAQIQEGDAERTNRRRLRRGGRLVTPLYTTLDVEQTMPLFREVRYAQEVEVAPGIVCRWMDAGHILGSASVEMRVREGSTEKVIVFSGDIGPRDAPLLRSPRTFDEADLVFLESTYGDRDHRPLDETLDEFVSILRSARTPTGRVIIPAFAVGRTQQLLYFIGELWRSGRLEHPRVYMDSPMAISATDLYRRYRHLFDAEARAIIEAGDSPLRFPGLHVARTREQSMAINALGHSVVVISASGMCTGGRVLHHLKHSLWREDAHIVIVGFQAEGTLGRRLVDGQRRVRVLGEDIVVRAKIHTLGGFSAHAGQSDLVRWMRSLAPARPRVILTHGEDPARRALRDRLRDDLRLDAELPAYGELIEV